MFAQTIIKNAELNANPGAASNVSKNGAKHSPLNYFSTAFRENRTFCEIPCRKAKILSIIKYFVFIFENFNISHINLYFEGSFNIFLINFSYAHPQGYFT